MAGATSLRPAVRSAADGALRLVGRSRWRLAATALALALAASGCGSAGSGPASGTHASGSASASAGGGSSAAPSRGGSTAAQVSTSGNPALAKLVATAGKEGQLNVEWGASLLGSVTVGQLGALMNRMFGLHVKVTFTPGPSFSAFGARLVQEAKSGAKSSTDLIFTDQPDMYEFVHDGMMATVDWGNTLQAAWSGKVPASTVKGIVGAVPTGAGSGSGDALLVGSYLPGITYNTKLVPAAHVPTTLADLTGSWWKGRVDGNVDAANLYMLGAKSLWGKARLISWTRAFSANVSGLIRCGQESTIASGQAYAVGLDCDSVPIRRLQQQGAPIAHVIPKDAALIGEWYVGVPRNSADPAAAQLFAVAIDTPAGQAIFRKGEDGLDNVRMPGSQIAQEVRKAEAQGAHFTDLTYEWFAGNPGIRGLQKQLISILRSAVPK